MAGDNTLNFTDASFDTEVIESKVPVLVDFWAEWCGPCKMMTPTIDAVANDYAGRVKVGKVNVDDNGGIAMRFQVRSIPTLMLFKGGKVVEHTVGAVGKPAVVRMIEGHLEAAVSLTDATAEVAIPKKPAGSLSDATPELAAPKKL